ncbi:MAG: TIGR04282 family arsenosugar biosynthesis glycosyltransferase [Desulfobacter sp.]|nr:MAG: TIGR04282 family arsenosugar biosynthesis glycosyltransferase [Desulfobacter sp.]
MIFLRAPEAGQVKTRLARDVGEDRALALYKDFVRAVLFAANEWAREEGKREIWICFCPAEKKALVRDWLGDGYTYLAQFGRDLGERMAAALDRAFDFGAQKAVILGSDVPQVCASHIEDAFAALDENEVVLGPSLDGGYWLIGARPERFSPEIFAGVDWGTPAVFSRTLELCRKNNLSHGEVASLQDVDTLADFQSLQPYL